ncbi:MAG: STAS domain-containing protein [Leptolyngbyaceae cyanobacterium CSU_1_3]|nr:STAS domain-containing protein [Leptolyngbyaceae cyanobacterium CSU_1_3]
MELAADQVVSLRFSALEAEASLETVVLQPYGRLVGISGANFRITLAQAIAQAAIVMVDLLWVEVIDEQSIAVLLAAMRQARSSGKALSFLSMDAATRSALDASWEQQRNIDSPVQTDCFTPGFEQFLDGYREAKLAGSEITKGF